MLTSATMSASSNAGLVNTFWSPETSDNNPWIQVSLDQVYRISAVQTAALGSGFAFHVRYSVDRRSVANTVWTWVYGERYVSTAIIFK